MSTTARPAAKQIRPANQSWLVRAVLVFLAALVALPALALARPAAAAAAAASAPPATPAAAPESTVTGGNAPTQCVNDVHRQFDSLKHHPEALAFHLGAGAGNPSAGRHYQGISRLPGTGNPRFITVRNGNRGPVEVPGPDEPGELNVVELASRNHSGERVRSNRMVANVRTADTPPPTEDKVVASFKFDGTGQFPAYRHLGGSQMWGDVAVLGMDRSFANATTSARIVLVDLQDPANPDVINEIPLAHQASWIGIAPFDNKLMLITGAHNGNPVFAYQFVQGPFDMPTTDLTVPNLKLKLLWQFDAAAAKAVGWPTGTDSVQTANLFQDCITKEIFLLGAYSLSFWTDASRDRIGLWKVNPTTGPRMQLVSKRQVWCDFPHVYRLCHMAAASGYHATPGGDLLLYATEHDNDGPQKTVRMAEFSSQDGYDQDNAYRPVSVPGDYEAAAGAPITLDGTGSHGAIAQARVELFDGRDFNDQGLVVDFPDLGLEDYRHLGRVDYFNDEASSVRWRIPVGCEAVLFDDKDFQGPRFPLPGDGSAREVSDLRKFSDDTTSVAMFGSTCDGRVVSWKWDLDDNGTIDAEGPTPTITPPDSGVHPLALEVCSGFNVCHRAVGTLDASAGSVPTTKATLAGTGGNADWYRSAVNVSLTATGDPEPTEIRLRATGADAMSPRTVPGATAGVTVDAEGETSVHFKAVSSSGEEAEQSVTVKVDSTAPALDVRAPLAGGRYTTDSGVTVRVDCSDAGSGIASCTPNGSPLDTSALGAKSVNATATDAAGNTASESVAYTVVEGTSATGDLVYQVDKNSTFGAIQRSKSDGTNAVQLADYGAKPVWSPDGSRIAFISVEGDGRQVFVMNADGTDVTKVTSSDTWAAWAPAWSPDGSRIAYEAQWVEPVAGQSPDIHRAIRTVPISAGAAGGSGGSPTTVVASDTVDLRDPSYARDGASITYIADHDLMSAPTAGVPDGELGTVLVGGLHWYQDPVRPSWSPDGSLLVFEIGTRETNLTDLYLWSGSGDPVTLTGTDSEWPPSESGGAPNEVEPTWLPDGRVLFGQDGNIYAMAATPGAQKVLLADLPWDVRSIDARGV